MNPYIHMEMNFSFGLSQLEYLIYLQRRMYLPIYFHVKYKHIIIKCSMLSLSINQLSTIKKQNYMNYVNMTLKMKIEVN